MAEYPWLIPAWIIIAPTIIFLLLSGTSGSSRN